MFDQRLNNLSLFAFEFNTDQENNFFTSTYTQVTKENKTKQVQSVLKMFFSYNLIIKAKKKSQIEL